MSLVTEGDSLIPGRAVVRLLHLPLRSRARLSQHMESLLREFALLQIREAQGPGGSLPQRLLDLAVELETTYAPHRAQRAQAMDDALAAGEEFFDSVYETSTASLGYVTHLLEVLERADDLCREERHLLTLPATDELVRFRRWLFGEIIGQLQRGPAHPWEGPGVRPDPVTGAPAEDVRAPEVTRPRSAGDDAGPAVVGEPLVLESVASAVAGARRHVRAVLRGQGAADLEEAAELGVSELATNAMLHARTAFTVTVRRTRQDRVRVEVTDGSPVPVQLRRFGVSATTGRGLQLVASVSHDWGIEVGPVTGKTVWFEPRAEVIGPEVPVEDWSADVEELLRA